MSKKIKFSVNAWCIDNEENYFLVLTGGKISEGILNIFLYSSKQTKSITRIFSIHREKFMVTDLVPFEEDEKILKIPTEIFSPLCCDKYFGLKQRILLLEKYYTHSQDDKLNGWWWKSVATTRSNQFFRQSAHARREHNGMESFLKPLRIFVHSCFFQDILVGSKKPQ